MGAMFGAMGAVTVLVGLDAPFNLYSTTRNPRYFGGANAI